MEQRYSTNNIFKPKNTTAMADKNKKKPKTHDDLQGFDIRINEFGEIVSSYSVEKLNEFLNKNVEDKKLKDRKDLSLGEEE